jgi:hypothetical protein
VEQSVAVRTMCGRNCLICINKYATLLLCVGWLLSAQKNGEIIVAIFAHFANMTLMLEFSLPFTSTQRAYAHFDTDKLV